MRSLKQLLEFVLEELIKHNPEQQWEDSSSSIHKRYWINYGGKEYYGLCAFTTLLAFDKLLSGEEFDLFSKFIGKIKEDSDFGFGEYIAQPGLLEPRIEFLKQEIEKL